METETSIWAESGSTELTMGSYGAGEANEIVAHRGRGTWISTTSLADGDEVFNLKTSLSNGTSSYLFNAMAISVDDVSGSNIATRIDWGTVNSSGNGLIRMSLDKDGNLGVGTNAPNYRLDVNGTASVNSLNINDAFTFPTADGTNGQVLTTDGSGNVTFQSPASISLGDTTMIADSDNDTKISVSATNNKIDFIQQDTTFHRFNSGQLEFLNTGNSVFIGEGAGAKDDLSDNRNVFVGSSSGDNATGSENNVGIGYNTLSNLSNVASNNHVAIGYSALSSFQNGLYNVAIGYRAGANFSGNSSSNVIIGDEAMLSASGQRNVAIGMDVLKTKSGSENIAIGSSSGGGGSGSENVFIGHDAGASVSTGDNNVFIGRQAGQNASFSQNIGIGMRAGDNFGANNNIAIGHVAGPSSGSGTKNIFIGYNAGQNETGSNKLYIDYSNSSNPLIYGEFDNNLLRVNGTLNVNNAFSFPTADGTNGQVLTTDGSGNVTFQSISSGNAIWDTNSTTAFMQNVKNLQLGVGSSAITQFQIDSMTHIQSIELGGDKYTTFGHNITADGTGIKYTKNGAGELLWMSDGRAQLSAYKTGAAGGNAGGNEGGYIHVDTNGVGINKTNPEQTLHVSGDVLITDSLFLQSGASNGYVLTSDATGYASWQAPAAADLGDTTMIADADNNTKVEVEQGANDNTIRLTTNGTERMQINGGGSVMIGTAVPSGLFTVSDNSNNYTGVFSNSASTSITEAIQANATGTSGSNTGVRATANGASISNYGLYGTANGTGATNYAMYADAQNGTANYAFYANAGDVVVNDTLRIQTNTANAGSVLMNAGAGAAYWAVDTLVCPAGFTKVNDDFCIETAERTASTWFVTDSVCAVNGYKLPDYSDWYGATALKTLTDETDDWEWVSNISQNNMMVVGNGNRRNRTFYDPATETAPYRCVYRKQ